MDRKSENTIIDLFFYLLIIGTTILVGLVVLANSTSKTILFNIFWYGMFVIATLGILMWYYSGTKY